MRLRPSLLAFLLVASAFAHAESKNPADYPLRIHIFARSETNFYHNRSMEESKGEGRANLFADDEVRGVDFNFECSEKLKSSFGYETYPAKWKKPSQELVVLLPVFGKSGSYFTCNLKTQVRDDAYLIHDGHMSSETPAQFKAWMVRHDYDPEHGKNIPTKSDPQTAASHPAAKQPATEQPAAPQP